MFRVVAGYFSDINIPQGSVATQLMAVGFLLLLC